MTNDDPFESDNATLPKWFRRWIKWYYSQWVIDAIDSAGYYHDGLVWKHPNRATKNRKLFMIFLKVQLVPTPLAYAICGGLWVFDHLPKWAQQKIQQSIRS